MVDYYGVLARAVRGVDRSTKEARQEIYTRARTALRVQLCNERPPLAVMDIVREQRALEHAIRKVEADCLRAARGRVVMRPPSAPRPGVSEAQLSTRGDCEMDDYSMARREHFTSLRPATEPSQQAAPQLSSRRLQRIATLTLMTFIALVAMAVGVVREPTVADPIRRTTTEALSPSKLADRIHAPAIVASDE